jgi:hypothetical protein
MTALTNSILAVGALGPVMRLLLIRHATADQVDRSRTRGLRNEDLAVQLQRLGWFRTCCCTATSLTRVTPLVTSRRRTRRAVIPTRPIRRSSAREFEVLPLRGALGRRNP